MITEPRRPRSDAPVHRATGPRPGAQSRPVPGANTARAASVGVAVGVLTILMPVGVFWLPQVTVYAVSLAVIAGIYIGFAVADGRPHVLAVETAVASGFILIAATALNESTGAVWLVAAGLALHGAKDLWQHRTQFVRNTRWWPPFCIAVDWTAALGLAGLAVLS